jgi:release factor glutamine methyltransferase
MTDLAEAIQYRLENSVDLLLFNPPYVPTLPQEVSHSIRFTFRLTKNNLVYLLLGNIRNISNERCFDTSLKVGSRQISSSWAGGVEGRQVIDRFLYNTVPLLLSPNGFIYLIIIKENNINEICATMKGMGFHMTIVLERKCGSENLMALRFNRFSHNL